jgi:hypothetical protein
VVYGKLPFRLPSQPIRARIRLTGSNWAGEVHSRFYLLAFDASIIGWLYVAGKLFLEILRAQGDQVFYDTLRHEYFGGCKRGCARGFTIPGSATTHNALESFK